MRALLRRSFAAAAAAANSFDVVCSGADCLPRSWSRGAQLRAGAGEPPLLPRSRAQEDRRGRPAGAAELGPVLWRGWGGASGAADVYADAELAALSARHRRAGAREQRAVQAVPPGVRLGAGRERFPELRTRRPARDGPHHREQPPGRRAVPESAAVCSFG